MDAGIVTNDMDFPVTPQAAAQVVEMADEQSRRAARLGNPAVTSNVPVRQLSEPAR